jgi:hypothetical protein
VWATPITGRGRMRRTMWRGVLRSGGTSSARAWRVCAPLDAACVAAAGSAETLDEVRAGRPGGVIVLGADGGWRASAGTEGVFRGLVSASGRPGCDIR